MPPAGPRQTGEVSSALEQLERPSLNNLTSSHYGKPEQKPNQLLESLGKTLISNEK